MSQKQENQAKTLRFLQDREMPRELADKWKEIMPTLNKLGPDVWQFVREHRASDKGLQKLISVEANSRGLTEEDLASAIEVFANIVCEAAFQDLPVEALLADLSLLEEREYKEPPKWLVDYEINKVAYRDFLSNAALRQHGNLFVQAKWRIDNIVATDLGQHLESLVLLLTIYYWGESGDQRVERKTITVTPQDIDNLIDELKNARSRMFPDKFKWLVRDVEKSS